MKTIEKGLKKFNFPEILVDLHRNRKTGTLTIYTGDVTKKVFFDKGNAIFSSSTDEEERLGEMLIKLGKITIEQYDKSVEVLKETGKRQGTILVELGYLTPKDLVLGVKAQVREIIYNLFPVEFANYAFEEGPLPNREVITLQMSVGTLIYEGMKRINNVVRVKRDMPDMDSVLVVNENGDDCFRDIVLSPRDKAMLASIDGEKTIKELVDSSPSATFEAMKTLYVLYITGKVVLRETPFHAEKQSAGGVEGVSSLSVAEDEFHERVNELFSHLHNLKPHDLLGIDETSDAETVQNNYYKLMNKYHPDQGTSSTDPIMVDKLIAISEEIQKAYTLLRDDDKRKEYFHDLTHALGKGTHDSFGEGDFKMEIRGTSGLARSLLGESDHEPPAGAQASDLFNGISFQESSSFADFNSFEEKREDLVEQSGEYIYILDEEPQEPFHQKDSEGTPATGFDSVVPPVHMDEAAENIYGYATKDAEEEIVAESDSFFDGKEANDLAEEAERAGENGFPFEGGRLENASDDFAGKVSLSESVDRDERGEKTEVSEHYEGFGITKYEIGAEMFFGINIRVIDMSVNGIALEVDRQLRVGKVFLMNFYDGDKTISVKAEVVRSEVTDSASVASGDGTLAYTVGMKFRELTAATMQNIAAFIAKHKVDDKKIVSYCMLNGIRVNDRLQIDPAEKNVLDVVNPCRIKGLSLSRMLIESEEEIDLYETVRMKISLREGDTISVLGSAVSCRAMGSDPELYTIEIEFTDISAEDRVKLKALLEEISRRAQSEVNFEGSGDRKDEKLNALMGETHETITPHSEGGQAEDSAGYRASPVQESVNAELVGLISEIKLLLGEIRAELSAMSAQKNPIVEIEHSPKEGESFDLAGVHAAGVPQEVVDDERGDIPKKSEQLTESVTDFLHEQDRGVTHIQDKTGPKVGAAVQEKTTKRKKLQAWHILIPSLFLIAALASFLVMSAPLKKKTVSQPAQQSEAEKESIPPVQKTQEQQHVAIPDTRELPPAPAVQKAPHTLELIASDSTWLSATIDDKTTKEMLMKPGDRVTWTAKNSISLVIGNAAGVQILFDGQVISTRGGKGKVVRLQLPKSKSS